MQRLRLKFGRGEELKFLSHLDLMRLWERALRRAELPLAYSEGFTPHPRVALAAPLSVGVTSEAELMDVFLSRWVAPQSFVTQAKKQLPQGLKILLLLQAEAKGQLKIILMIHLSLRCILQRNIILSFLS